MGNPKLRMILRCTGLALLVLGVFVLLPATAQAVAALAHGATFSKSCLQDRTVCTSPADCSDNNICTTDLCSGTTGSNKVDCTFTVTDSDGFGDSLTILQATDAMDPSAATGSPLSSDAILVSGTTGTVTPGAGGGCSVGDDIGGTAAVPAPTVTCKLAAGASISFRSNFYVIQPADTSPIPDQATARLKDECDAVGTTGCSTTPVTGGFGASTTFTSGCSNVPLTAACCSAGALLPATTICRASAGVCDQAESCTGTSASCPADTFVPATTICRPAATQCDVPESCTGSSAACPADVNPPCPTGEICRTPGFWGTHACPPAGCEKPSPPTQNITQIVLNNFPSLQICGHPINTTDLTNTSAVEAICVAIKGDSSLQVARQLTAAALNCILTNSAGCAAPLNQSDPCAGVSVHDVFAACNDPANLCGTTAVVNSVTVDCIEALDCFNNGGTFNPGTGPADATCLASLNSCHDALLNANGCAAFEPPGPAGSSKECNDARKDNCTILCSHACDNNSPPPVCIN